MDTKLAGIGPRQTNVQPFINRSATTMLEFSLMQSLHVKALIEHIAFSQVPAAAGRLPTWCLGS